MENLILNPDYRIKYDVKRYLLCSSDGVKNILYKVHPVFGCLLSYFDGSKNLSELLKYISSKYDIKEESLLNVVNYFSGKSSAKYLALDNKVYYFPKDILIENTHSITRKDLDKLRNFTFEEIDLVTSRNYIPESVLFIVGTDCITDCEYCYADRTTKYKELSINRVIELIRELKDLGVEEFDLSGGDLFSYRNWELLLTELKLCEYMPYISTKTPIGKKTIDKLYDLGIRRIQLSFDSLDECLLQQAIKVKSGYIKSMLNTIKNLDKKGISITLKMTLSKRLCTVVNVQAMLEYANTISAIDEFMVTIAGISQQIDFNEFMEIKPTLTQSNELENYLNSLNYDFDLTFDSQIAKREKEFRNFTTFNERIFCGGNNSMGVILPDGKLTICEELYWNPNFIIGDTTKTSFYDAWNSLRAHELNNIKQSDIPKDSACHSCSDLNKCRNIRTLCWKEITAAYSSNNYLYPHPACPKSPELLIDYFD